MARPNSVLCSVRAFSRSLSAKISLSAALISLAVAIVLGAAVAQAQNDGPQRPPWQTVPSSKVAPADGQYASAYAGSARRAYAPASQASWVDPQPEPVAAPAFGNPPSQVVTEGVPPHGESMGAPGWIEPEGSSCCGCLGGGCLGNFDCCCCDLRGLEVNFELTILRPEAGAAVLHDVIPDSLQVNPTYDLNAAYRVSLGRSYDQGVGWRASFWTFSDDAGLTQPKTYSVAQKLQLYTVDLELTRRGSFCGWDILSSIGARVAGTNTSLHLDDTPDQSYATLTRDFTGGGLTFSLGTEQKLGCCGWSVYGGFRGSLLYGASHIGMDYNLAATIDGYTIPAEFQGHHEMSATIIDQTVAIWELQLGLQYEQPMMCGTFFARVGVESQLWQLPPVLLGVGADSIGMLGPTARLGLRW